MYTRLLAFLLLFLTSSLTCIEKTRVCLLVCLEKEEDGLWECLKSGSKIADYICVIDLQGSSRTLFILEEALRHFNVPGNYTPLKWESRQDSLRLAVESAQGLLKNHRFDLDSTYFLILDPDAKIHQIGAFEPSSFIDHVYSIQFQSKALGFVSYEPRLFRSSIDSNTISSIYYSASVDSPYKIAKLRSVLIEQIEIALSKEKARWGGVQAPQTLRELFYCALTHKGLGEYERAAELLEQCLQLSDSNEKSWLFLHLSGDCYQKWGCWEKALYFYLEAFQKAPTRAEPLHKIANYYRLNAQNDLAYLFAKHGSEIPKAKEVNFSPYPSFLEYQFDEELSITAFYTPFREQGLCANDRLLLRKNVPWYTRSQAYRNYLFYAKPLPNADYLPIQIELPHICAESDERYHPMNPSIQKTDTGYRIICRTVNYTQTGAKFFHTVSPDGIFRTRNFLLEYDPSFRLIQQTEILENLPRSRYRAFCLEGIDDCRLFDYEGSSWFTCTTSDTNPTGSLQISLCKLSSFSTHGTTLVEKLLPLKGPDPHRCEKNWLPFILDGKIHVIYTYEPFTLYQVDPEAGICTAIQSTPSSQDLSQLRGSAGPIPFDEGFLVLAHEVVYQSDDSRCYLHRFLYFDSLFHLKKISKPFYFRHLGVEFSCGMTLNHEGNSCIIGLGEEDHDAFLCTVPLETIRTLLEPFSFKD